MNIFLYSRYLSASNCIDIVRRNSVFVTNGSCRVDEVCTWVKQPTQLIMLILFPQHKEQGIFLLPPGWDARPSQSYPSTPPPPPPYFIMPWGFIHSTTFKNTQLYYTPKCVISLTRCMYSWMKRGRVRVKHFAHEHNTLTLAGLEHRAL